MSSFQERQQNRPCKLSAYLTHLYILCKTIEHIVASTLTKHCNRHNILYDLHHGFSEHRSCETELTQLVEDLARNLTSGKQTDLILLDFSKAFDKVNHLKLLYKLQINGVRGKTLGWIEFFFPCGEKSDCGPKWEQLGCTSSFIRGSPGVIPGSHPFPVLY